LGLAEKKQAMRVVANYSPSLALAILLSLRS
jgi:hypothetical protein